MTLLADIVEASRAVAETSSRSRKVATLAELDRAIAEVEAVAGSGSAARRKEILGELLGRATEQEADFVKRLFTGELRQGALAGVMVEAIAKAAGVSGELARRALMLSGDLTRTAEIAIADGEAGLHEVGFRIYQPILPMLASTAASVAEAVASFARSSVEWKLDGIRIQIHRRGDEVRIYTRNLNDITYALPGIVEAVRRLPVTDAVLDGEALWMGEHGPAAFQDTVSQIDVEAPPEGIVTFLFDLLYVDGDDLLDTPLEERERRLEAIAPHLKIPGVVTSDPQAAENVLDEALRAGHEGVVVKDAASLYSAGRRRQGWLSNLHLGARDPRTGEFLMVGKCCKGLTDELLAWQTRELLARETDRREIAVLVRPELVVEVALDGVQSSTRYPGGVALRFARVKRYRPDKRAEGADTIDDLRALLPTLSRRRRARAIGGWRR